MVNFSAMTPEQKPLLSLPPKLSKSISKSYKKRSPKSKVPLALESLSIETKLINNSLDSSFSESSFTSSQLNQSCSLPNHLINILQPFCNYSLFPSLLQRLVLSSEKLGQKDILQMIYQLKTPDNQINFQKKIEKMKLLALGQETILQNYMKDKYMANKKPQLMKDYYKYMKTKVNLLREIQEIKGKSHDSQATFEFQEEGLSHEEIHNAVVPSIFRFNQENSRNFLEKNMYAIEKNNNFNPSSLLYDNFGEHNKHEYFFELQGDSMEEDAEKNEGIEDKNDVLKNNCFGKHMFFYDEDKFLAKEGDYLQKC